MKAFAAAGIIAAASAATTEASPTPSFASSLFDSSKYYGYGYGNYAYPEYDHKEELTPVKEHKKHSTYRTNNIDIFAHSDSDSSEEHHGYGHHTSHSSHSSSDTSEDEHRPAKAHHVFLTGYGPEGDHCHDGDHCGKEDSASDYTDSDYQTVEEESEEHHFKPAPGCGGERCARVDFDWNDLGIKGTMDIYQPYGHAPELLFDGDFDGLTPGSKHEVRIKSLPKYIDPVRLGLFDHDEDAATDPRAQYDDADTCANTGSLLAWVGTSRADKYGSGSLRSLSDDLCLEDFIGNAIEIRGTYSAYESTYAILACGNVREVACPPRPRYYF